jgi:DNA polymerase III sliding clamp (beta) subunit (PCNA family)
MAVLKHTEAALVKNSNKNMKKITIPTSQFAAVLKKVKEVIAKKPVLALLENILIKVRRKDIEIIATDLLVTIKAVVEITNDGDCGYEFLLPFKFLHDTMLLINDSNITIEFIERTKKEEGKKVTILQAILTTFSDKYDLDWLDNTDDWPKLPEFPQENSIGIADGFIEWLNLMLDTASTDVCRPAMQNIYIGIANNGIAMAATNANIISEKTFQCESTRGVDLLVNPKIAKALKGFKETSISWSDTHLCFVSSNMTLIGTLQNEKFPNYRAVFPDASPNFTISLTELTGVMEKMSLTGKNADVWLKREIGHVVVESFDADYNRKIMVRLGADYYGPCERVTLIPHELLKLLGQVKYATLSLAITGPNTPIIITSESDDTYRSLIMPQTQL